MHTEPKPIPYLSHPRLNHPHLKEFLSFLPELNKESDRGVVLIVTSFIDELMRRTLLAFFIESKASVALVEGFNAPLGTFSTRISAAFALGLITDREFRDCEILRKVRNKFAHHIHVSFGDPSIRDVCLNLTFSAKRHDDVEVSARGAFTSAAISLILNLTNRPAYVARKRRICEEWPY